MLVLGNQDILWSWLPEINVDTVNKIKSHSILLKETQTATVAAPLEYLITSMNVDVIFFSRALLHNASKLPLTWLRSIFLPVLGFLVQLSDYISLYSSLL